MNVASRKLSAKWTALWTAVFVSLAPVGWADVGPQAPADLVQMNKELMAKITELQKKVDRLESRVEAQERGGPAVSVPAPSGGQPGDGVMRTQGGDIRLSGFVDTSWNHNFKSPPTAVGGTNATGNSTLRAFDRESNTFDLNSVQLNLERPAPSDGGVGFKTEFVYGTDAQVIESTGFLGGTDEFSIQEAYVDLRLPILEGVTVWAGKFATMHGAEVIENYMNWTASRSYLFTLAIPFTHTGVRAMTSFLEGKLQTGVGLVNGWDNNIDSNTPKDVEAMVQWSPYDNTTLRANFMIGPQRVEERGDNRGLIDLVATWKPLPVELPKLTLMANYDYGFEERLSKATAAAAGVAPVESGPADWQGYALYAKYDLYDWLTLAARWEQFWDDQGVRVGTLGMGERIWEMTYNADVKIYENLLTRLEYRHDHSDKNNDRAVRGAFDGATDNNQDTFLVSLIYLFG